MKIVLINPPLSIDSDMGTGNDIRFFPEGLAVIATVLIKAGYDTNVIDLCRQPITELDNFSDVDAFGFTGMINQFSSLEQIMPLARSICPNAKIILGGPLVTSDVELISQLLDYDVAVNGEGEKTIVSLLDNINCPNNADGLTSRTSNGKWYIAPHEFIDQKDFVEPNFELFDVSWYLDGQIRKHLKESGLNGKIFNNLMISRGCARKKNCAFCGQAFGRKIRCKPQLHIKKEVEMWIKSGAEVVRFQDSNITLLPQETRDYLFNLLGGFRVSWGGNTRVDAVDPILLDWMFKSGCKTICYGIESFSPSALKGVGKGASIKAAKRAIDMTHDAGIHPSAFFLIGLPGETRESLLTEVKFAKEENISVIPYILCPIPGTPIFNVVSTQVTDIRDFLCQCSGWEEKQINKRKLYINLTDLPDELLIDTYLELRELG